MIEILFELPQHLGIRTVTCVEVRALKLNVLPLRTMLRRNIGNDIKRRRRAPLLKERVYVPLLLDRPPRLSLALSTLVKIIRRVLHTVQKTECSSQ